MAAQRVLWFPTNSTCLAYSQSTPRCLPGAWQRTGLLMEGSRANTNANHPKLFSTWCWSGKMFKGQGTPPINF